MNPDQSIYPSWALYSIDQQGENRANNGTEKLKEWFNSLNSEQKQSIKDKLPSWKETSKLRIPGLKYD